MNNPPRRSAGRTSASKASHPGRHLPGSRAAIHDPRWPQIVAALARLRGHGWYAVRIVDADCGAGSLLIHAAHQARSLGFTAIEGRGIDGSPALIGRARAAADRARDFAIGLEFECADMVGALEAEQDFAPDILLCHGPASGDWPEAVVALGSAGAVVIGDGHRPSKAGAAA